MSQPIGTGHCHILIARTAQAMAGEKYELLMMNNTLFQEWKDEHPGATGSALQRAFVAKYWGRYVEEARATLATMLNTNLDTALKDQIADALIKDHALRRGLRAPQGQV